MRIDQLHELAKRTSEGRLQILACLNGGPVARPTIKTVKEGFLAGVLSIDQDGEVFYYWVTEQGSFSQSQDMAKTYPALSECKRVALSCFDQITVPLKEQICPSRERIEFI